MLSSERRTACFMILPVRLAVNTEIGTSTIVRRVSRQFIQSAKPRQEAARSGSRMTLLSRVFNPWPTESMSLVNREINSADPWSLKLDRSSAMVRRKK
jgi:hypothetical protein